MHVVAQTQESIAEALQAQLAHMEGGVRAIQVQSPCLLLKIASHILGYIVM